MNLCSLIMKNIPKKKFKILKNFVLICHNDVSKIVVWFKKKILFRISNYFFESIICPRNNKLFEQFY